MNYWTFYGNLGNQATETISNGKRIVTFSVAINRGYYDKNGDWVERVQWVRVARFYRLEADLQSTLSRLKKGSTVMVMGDPSVSAFTDNMGKPAASLEVLAKSYQIIKSINEN